MNDPRWQGDAAMIGGGALAVWSHIADLVTPILSAIFVLLSVVWLLWRMMDRWRHGPAAGKRDE